MTKGLPVIDTTKDLSALFIKQAAVSPDAVALEDGDVTYTYAQLDAEVDALARRLRGYGVGRNVQAGVLLPRCAHYVIACLAILRAGGAFLALELAYPPELLSDVIEDAKPVVVITDSSERSKVVKQVPVICLDQQQLSTELNGNAKDSGPLPRDDDLDRLAFVSYSSGTTGKPKGIANPHRAPVLSYNLRFLVQDVKPGDRVACNVFFIWEIIRPLLRGATVVVVPDEVSYDPAALVDLLASKRVTETLMTPTLLATVLSSNPDIKSRLPELRTLWFNGEVVTTDLAGRSMKALPHTRLLNCYSACETHEIACGDIREMYDKDSLYCPVGPPMDPEHTYILDEQGKRITTNEIGELFIGGPMLAWGYINRPETTAEAFTPNPYDTTPGARMYKTGDRARILPSGILEISGRVGTMIKLRGYSVVPGKVESEILKRFAACNCSVVAHGEGLERQLVAYVVRDREASQDRLPITIDESGRSPEARRALAPYLAHYMIPTLWVEMDALPTNEVSGKVDIKSLPPPPNPTQVNGNHKQTVSDSVSFKDVAAFWASILKVPQSSLRAEDNFFDLGGQSLMLADLSSRLSKNYGFRVPIARLAEVPTLAGHLAAIRAARDGHSAAIQAELPSILRKDSTLDDNIQPHNVNLRPIDTANTVLLTGVTGFLGAFLLNDLLESTNAQIICLVRFGEPTHEGQPEAVARIRKNLLDLGLWRDSIMERVEIVPGNLALDSFGLSHEEFDDLASRVQVIVHAAATVNLVYPYAALQKANVEGTREIIRLACKSGATLQYVSTNGVLPPSDKDGWTEDTILPVEDVPEKLPDGYGQTKWVAEQLVLEAGRRGLPVKIHRAGTISGHSTTGASNAWDLLSAIIVESIRLGYAPDVDGWRAEMTPVDFVSKSIIHLSSQTAPQQTIFHLGDPDPITIRSVFEQLEQLGYPTKPLGWDEWVTLWNERRGTGKGGDGAFTVDILRSGMPTVDFLKGIVVLNNSKTRPFRIAVERPKVDPALLSTYTRHWFARGWLPRAPRKDVAMAAKPTNKSPLYGRVAVITGASSGIGAAVAAALVKQGCHVALGARRLEALEAVQRKFGASEGKSIIRATDVTDKKQVEELVRAATDELGAVDILVSCAGVMYYTMMANVQTEEWDRTVDVNCKGLLHCLSSTVPRMLSRGSGHIVAISSDAGRKVFPGLGVYSASKFFVEATLQSLRLETAGKGLRVTSVQPGNTATDLLGMSTDAEAIKKYGEPTGAQILDPSDVANSIVYALSQPAHVAVNEVLIEPRDEPI